MVVKGLCNKEHTTYKLYNLQSLKQMLMSVRFFFTALFQNFYCFCLNADFN